MRYVATRPCPFRPKERENIYTPCDRVLLWLEGRYPTICHGDRFLANPAHPSLVTVFVQGGLSGPGILGSRAHPTSYQGCSLGFPVRPGYSGVPRWYAQASGLAVRR